MPKILVVGATRGLGEALAKQYASAGNQVYGTARSTSAPQESASFPITWIGNVDVSTESAGKTITDSLKGVQLDTVIITAGYFGKESFDEPNFEAEVQMYKISSIGPVFIVHHLVKAGLLKKGSKVILVSSESGSIALRHESEGGGMFGHHASKTALNMVGKLLSLDLKDKGIAVGLVHPGFMRTEMTKSVGFDKFWDAGGAVTPDEAAASLREFVDNKFDISLTGQYWAPRGPG
ncbi:MAG: hypothetical protein Q9165_007317 [Trypethelium subeluteriae]